MIITIQIEAKDNPRFVETVARELRERMSITTTPEINVVYPLGRVIKF